MVKVIKRDSQVVFCEVQKIITAMSKASWASGEAVDAPQLAYRVYDKFEGTKTIDVETIQDLVEETLIEANHPKTAKAYILYRKERERIREGQALIKATQKLFNSYLEDQTWRVKENANTRKSVNGMNNYIRERLTEQYWLNDVYPASIKEAHEEGKLHLHD